MITLVVPTNRPDSLNTFLSAWDPLPFDRVIVVEDAQEVSVRVPAIETFSWREIEQLAPNPNIFSRNDSAIRCFGFWRAWLSGADVVITLDDDCYPVGDPADFVAAHLDVLGGVPRWESTVPGLRVRGLPYGNLGSGPQVELNMGLWKGVPDLDARTTMAANGQLPSVDEGVLGTTRLMPNSIYWPMSGMNLAVSRRALPLMYFPPMGKGRPYSRFDDIWCGLVVQRIAHHLGWRLTCGAPAVEHQRASDPAVNLVKEAPGLPANERMWEIVDAIPLSAAEPLACLRQIGEGLVAAVTEDRYVAEWGRCLLGWCDLFEAEP